MFDSTTDDVTMDKNLPMCKIDPIPLTTLLLSMQWELSDDATQQEIDRFETPSVRIPKKIVTFSSEYSIRILKQFDRYNDYESYSKIVMSGFVRDSEKEISSIVPSVVTDICFSYYFQNEGKYVFITCALYKILKSKNLSCFSGTTLISIMNDHNLLQNQFIDEDIPTICENMVKFGFIELLFYQTTFSSFFHKKQERVLFNDSEDYTYHLTEHSVNAFEEYCSPVIVSARAE